MPPRVNSRGCSPGSARSRQTVAESCWGDRGRLPPTAQRVQPPRRGAPGTPRIRFHMSGWGLPCEVVWGWQRRCRFWLWREYKSWPKDQKVRGWSGVWGHRECSLQHFLLPIFNYPADKSECNPFTTTGFYSRKGTFWSVTEGHRIIWDHFWIAQWDAVVLLAPLGLSHDASVHPFMVTVACLIALISARNVVRRWEAFWSPRKTQRIFASNFG